MRELANIHRYTAQCVLMINMFNEKIFLLLWFWFIFVAICTGLNLLYWVIITLSKSQRNKPIRLYFKVANALQLSVKNCNSVEKFAYDVLHSDGVLILRFISFHITDLISAELVSYLFEEFEKSISRNFQPKNRLTVGGSYNIEKGLPSVEKEQILPSTTRYPHIEHS